MQMNGKLFYPRPSSQLSLTTYFSPLKLEIQRSRCRNKLLIPRGKSEATIVKELLNAEEDNDPSSGPIIFRGSKQSQQVMLDVILKRNNFSQGNIKDRFESTDETTQKHLQRLKQSSFIVRHFCD